MTAWNLSHKLDIINLIWRRYLKNWSFKLIFMIIFIKNYTILFLILFLKDTSPHCQSTIGIDSHHGFPHWKMTGRDFCWKYLLMIWRNAAILKIGNQAIKSCSNQEHPFIRFPWDITAKCFVLLGKAEFILCLYCKYTKTLSSQSHLFIVILSCGLVF